MKAVKTIALLLVLLLFGTSLNFAQTPEKTKLVTVNLLSSLEHEVNGVVESSIYNTLFLQKYFPGADMNKVINKLNEVAKDSDSPSIRYKAQLASLYLAYYNNGELNFEDYKVDREKLFQKIAYELESSLLVSNK